MNLRSIALSIGIGLLMVAAAIYVKDVSVAGVTAGRDAGEAIVYGNPKAPIRIVEFSDFECPFCARAHPTLQRLVDESEGGVSWEYRHFPLSNHSNAAYAAAVGECVFRESGSESFFSFSHEVFNNQSTLNKDALDALATGEGVSLDALHACIDSEEVLTQITEDQEAAVSLGLTGTPFSVVVFKDGSMRPVSGALPYDQWVSLLGPDSNI